MTAPASAALESLLIGSADPDRLRRWYVDALGVEPDADGFQQFGPVGVQVTGRDDVPASTAEPGRYVLNFHVPDIQVAAQHLDGLGAAWVAPVEYRDAGLWFGAVEDPDGNHVQLIEITPEYWVQKQRRTGGDAGPIADATAVAKLPAQDLDRARTWYAEVLGLEPADERDGGLLYSVGGVPFTLFASEGAPSGDHTQLGFAVRDLELAVSGLRDRGVEFEGGIVDVHGHYPSTGATGERATWFRDSEGNLIGISQLTYG